jgi:hypothetical protein
MESSIYVKLMLYVTADGQKSPPCMILSRKTIPKNQMFLTDVVRAQKNGCMITDLIKDWVK